MRSSFRNFVCRQFVICWALGVAADSDVALPPEEKGWNGAFALDGRFVHTAGELQLHVTNWGLLGSRPGQDSSYSQAPSAMWPAGSGVDYLFAGGPWVGAIRNGVPLVTTGQFENELMPSASPDDVIYELRGGEPNGDRYPFANGDDDGDGFEDEDPRNGYDDDGDGRADEDFAQFATQTFRARMVDTNPLARELWPSHDPLEIEVTQATHQWDNELLEDVVAIEYTIRNIGATTLEDVAFGFFADPDIGPRDVGSTGQDDLVGYFNETAVARDGLPIPIRMAYAYDCPGIDGDTRGYIGFVLLNAEEPPDIRGADAFRWFTRNDPFDSGGEPLDDADRYALLRSRTVQPVLAECRYANDYRLLIATQPSGGRRLAPGASLEIQMGIVMGSDLRDLVANAAELVRVYVGQWFDRDGSILSGRFGRETQLCPADPRQTPNPFLGLIVDCGDPVVEECGNELALPHVVLQRDLDQEGCIWVNMDCELEYARGRIPCGCFGNLFDETRPELIRPCTGVQGREHNVRWIAKTPPPSPRFRVWETGGRVHVFWGDEIEPYLDDEFGLPAFEGYRVWRADGWTRPAGSSTSTGPSSELWQLIAQFDVVDQFTELVGGELRQTLPLGPNTGLDQLDYVPQVLRAASEEAVEFASLRSLCEQIVAENPGLGRTDPVRYRDESGAISNLGQRYPELAAWECCPDVTDTLVWNAMGARWYEYVDDRLVNGLIYFHALTTTTRAYANVSDAIVPIGLGIESNPRGNFVATVPQSVAQSADERAAHGQNIFVVPNPATREALADFSQLQPNEDDPTGVRVEFRNLPRALNHIRIFTLSGDLVAELKHDGRGGRGSQAWNLVSRNGQEIVSGIYLYTVSSSEPGFDRVVGRFVVIR